MCKQHALRIAWTIARSIAFLDFRVLRWKFTYDWKCVNTTYRVPLFMPTACFPEGPSPHFTFCSFWRRRQRLEAVLHEHGRHFWLLFGGLTPCQQYFRYKKMAFHGIIFSNDLVLQRLSLNSQKFVKQIHSWIYVIKICDEYFAK